MEKALSDNRIKNGRTETAPHHSAAERPAPDRRAAAETRVRRPAASWLTLAAPVLYALTGAVVVAALMNSGKWPAGDDVMYHIYRGEKVYQAITNGHFWVPLDLQMYNGVELLRYWSPLPAYVMALCQWICRGNSLYGYLAFTWLTYLLSAMAWYLIGVRRDRPALGMAIGFLWFFLPQNLSYYFGSGNLAGMLGIACVLPWLVCFLAEYMEAPTARNMWKLALITALMAFCHSGFALLAMLVMLIWLLLRRAFNRNDRTERNGVRAVVIVILGFLLTGVWFLASRRGVSSVDYSEQLRSAFQSLAYTLDSFDRSRSQFAHYYFGLSAFLIAALGIFFARRREKAGFLTAVLICLLTSETAYQVIRLIPGSSFLWTSRMIGAALAVFLFSLLDWKTLRKPAQVVFVLLLAADCALSAGLITGNHNGASVTSRFNDEQRATLLTEAKQITKQRIALIDGSSLASAGAYLTTTWNGQDDAAFGAGYEAAVTRQNITMLNRAAVDGCYDYLFDRALELGNDTVVIQVSQLKGQANDLEQVKTAAEGSGYTLRDANGSYLLYHRNTSGSFGTKTKYRAIAIGTNAADIAEFFPAFREADETDISRYTYRELKDYDVIYLSGFEMSDRTRAEKLLRRLADHGTRIVVAADAMPEQASTDGKSFLGVTVNPVKFTNGYPALHTRLGTLDLDLFPAGSENWNTVYLTGLRQTWGYVSENGAKLAFYGTAGSDNIVFLGLNLSYYYALTHDDAAGRLLGQAMTVSSKEIPDRRVVPLTVAAFHGGLTIRSGTDDVNTTLAYHDIFTSRQNIRAEHNLLVVGRGTTRIRYRTPYLLPGLGISLGALALLILLTLRDRQKTKRDLSSYEGEAISI